MRFQICIEFYENENMQKKALEVSSFKFNFYNMQKTRHISLRFNKRYTKAR